MRPIVIGIGNPDRGDDAVGRVVAQKLRDRIGDRADVVEARGEATEIVSLLQGRDAAILIDACVSGAPAGTTLRLDMRVAPAPRKGGELSSHGLGLAEAIGLARALGALPEMCVVYAIEGASFAHGAAMSEAVAAAADEVATAIAGRLD